MSAAIAADNQERAVGMMVLKIVFLGKQNTKNELCMFLFLFICFFLLTFIVCSHLLHSCEFEPVHYMHLSTRTLV